MASKDYYEGFEPNCLLEYTSNKDIGELFSAAEMATVERYILACISYHRGMNRGIVDARQDSK